MFLYILALFLSLSFLDFIDDEEAYDAVLKTFDVNRFVKFCILVCLMD